MQIARATILARACYNTCSDFHMENTGSTDYTITSSSTTSAILFYSTIMCGLILTTTDTCILALYSSMYIRNCFISSNYACCLFLANFSVNLCFTSCPHLSSSFSFVLTTKPTLINENHLVYFHILLCLSHIHLHQSPINHHNYLQKK